jgi:hypothetical protein
MREDIRHETTDLWAHRIAALDGHAASLPISGRYCSDGDAVFDANGLSTEDGGCAPRAGDRGPVFHMDCVEYGGEGDTGKGVPVDGFTVTFAENIATGTLTYTEVGQQPIVLQRCPE